MHLTKRITTEDGVSALGLMVVLAILAAAATVAVPLLYDPPLLSREQLTLEKMQAIKTAIIGDPSRQPLRSRHSFGFVGDLGVLPSNLEELFLQGGYPDFTAVLDHHIRFGWRGPYLQSALSAQGHRLALLDAWGTPFAYTGDGINQTIESAGPDRDFPNSGDNLSLQISEDEWRTTVTGQFFDRNRSPLNETLLSIYFPDGSATLAETVLSPADPHAFNSETDPLFSGTIRKIPIGLRSVFARDIEVTKLAALNGGPVMNLLLIGPEAAQDAVLFENSFDDPADLGPAGSTSPLQNIRGTWTVSGGDISSSWGHLAFGLMGWRDYRLEADITSLSGSWGYGIYYRSDGAEQTSGYIFQYDPGLYQPLGTGIELVIRRVFLGNENYFPSNRRFLARARYSRAQFESLFGTRIWDDSHHVSITVVGTRHIIKLNGVPVIDVIDEEPLFPCGGLCGMAGFRTWIGSATAFHYVFVHTIPPLPNGEIVRWPLEEGNGSRFFGSGFLVDGPEQNGTTVAATRLATGGIYGAAIQLDRNQVLTVPDHSDLDLNDSGTLSIWIYPEESNQRSGGLIHKGNTADNRDLAYSLEFHSNNRLRLILVDSAGNSTVLESLTRFDNAQRYRWHHLLACWDSQGMAIYLNGQLDNQNALAVSSRNSTGPLNLGAQYSFSVHPQWRNYPFYGRIDEIQLFRQRLSSAQISLLYQSRAN